jgi:RimJ/RimL family protein N-acetyltransferase
MSRHWPLADLRVRSARLELRWPTDAELDDLGDLANKGVHDPQTMPFCVEWTDQQPAALARGVAQFSWRAKGEWQPNKWSLPFGVFVDGEPVGVQELFATGFPTRRIVESGSWLGRAYQGRGYGSEMRRALLSFAFGTLGAAVAETAAFADNVASQAVSAACGYVDNGTTMLVRRGEAAELRRYRLTREAWAVQPWPVTVHGFEACRAFFGLDGDTSW